MTHEERTMLRGRIPKFLVEEIDNWVKFARPPGHFMQQVLKNNLRGAFEAADMRSMMALPDIVSYLWSHVPADCWGSVEKYDTWKGLPDNKESGIIQ